MACWAGRRGRQEEESEGISGYNGGDFKPWSQTNPSPYLWPAAGHLAGGDPAATCMCAALDICLGSYMKERLGGWHAVGAS